MIVRWIGAAILEAKRRFRRVRGITTSRPSSLRSSVTPPAEALDLEKRVA